MERKQRQPKAMVQTTSRREIRVRMEALSRRKQARQGKNYRIVMFSLDRLGSPQVNCRKLCLGNESPISASADRGLISRSDEFVPLAEKFTPPDYDRTRQRRRRSTPVASTSMYRTDATEGKPRKWRGDFRAIRRNRFALCPDIARAFSVEAEQTLPGVGG